MIYGVIQYVFKSVKGFQIAEFLEFIKNKYGKAEFSLQELISIKSLNIEEKLMQTYLAILVGEGVLGTDDSKYWILLQGLNLINNQILFIYLPACTRLPKIKNTLRQGYASAKLSEVVAPFYPSCRPRIPSAPAHPAVRKRTTRISFSFLKV